MMMLFTILFCNLFIYTPIFLALPDFKNEERKVVGLYFGASGLTALFTILIFLDGTTLVIGTIISIALLITAPILFYSLELKAKERIKYLLSGKATKFYLNYQKNRPREVLENYDEIQTMINYTVENEVNNVEYASYIAQLYYGYYNNTSVVVPHSYVSQILQNYVVRNGLRLSLEIPFDIDKYDTDEVEILVTKYKTSIDIIRSIIGKELNEETKQHIEDIWQSFADDLEKGIEEVQKAKEMIKKQEHEAYELEQKRLQELLENEINWLRSDK